MNVANMCAEKRDEYSRQNGEGRVMVLKTKEMRRGMSISNRMAREE
jgi:hypothetical protein